MPRFIAGFEKCACAAAAAAAAAAAVAAASAREAPLALTRRAVRQPFTRLLPAARVPTRLLALVLARTHAHPHARAVFTWAHFKWAMSVLMSRQNNVPNASRASALPLCDAAAPDYDPYTSWPAGVRRYSASREMDVSVIPLFDFANHASVSRGRGGRGMGIGCWHQAYSGMLCGRSEEQPSSPRRF